MSKNIEVEIRCDLSEKDYEIVRKDFSNTKTYTQTNYYLDTKELSFSCENHGLRIREKNGKFELTLKSKINDNYLEINQEITAKTKEILVNPGYFPSGEVKDYLLKNTTIDPNKLSIICSLKTTRLDIPFECTIISLDKNEYFNVVDYNIECESINNNDVENTLNKFLSKYNIKIKKSPYTKLQKALLQLK